MRFPLLILFFSSAASMSMSFISIGSYKSSMAPYKNLCISFSSTISLFLIIFAITGDTPNFLPIAAKSAFLFAKNHFSIISPKIKAVYRQPVFLHIIFYSALSAESAGCSKASITASFIIRLEFVAPEMSSTITL